MNESKEDIIIGLKNEIDFLDYELKHNYIEKQRVKEAIINAGISYKEKTGFNPEDNLLYNLINDELNKVEWWKEN